MRQINGLRQSSLQTAGSQKAKGWTRGWRQRLDETFQVLATIHKSTTTTDICTCVLAYGARFGATSLLAGTIPQPSASRREQLSHVLLDAWPHEWSLRYFSNGYLYRDPTIGLVRQASAPFLWSEIRDVYKVSQSSSRVMHEATEFHLHDGLTVSFSMVERSTVGFSIAGEKLEFDPLERSAMQLVTAYALSCAIILTDRRASLEPVHLSPRQRDVLRWASEGLTLHDIAERLNISSNTADTHLRAVRERLGVSSTVHAVAEAFRLGLIS